MTMNRRNFIKGASLGTVLVAGSGFLAGCAGNTAIDPVSAPDKWDHEADVVVAGSGNGGLSAAAAAADEGASVIVAEISNFLGGGTAYSEGFTHSWGITDWEEYNKETEGLHDTVLTKKYLETFRKQYIPWLEANGIPLTKLPGGVAFLNDWLLGSGGQGYLRNKSYFDALIKFITDRKGTIMTQTRVVRLVTDEQGAVLGIEAKNVSNGTRIFIKANKGVVLATGGFQNNKGLMSQVILNGDFARIMAVPYSTGEGMLMAQGAGAMTTSGFADFSGTLTAIVPGPATEESPELWEKARGGDPATLPGIGNGRMYTPSWVNVNFPEFGAGILVNLEGKRFKDEVSPIDAKYPRLLKTILGQSRGVSFMLADQAIHENTAGAEDSLQNIKNKGGQVYTGNTIEELAGKLKDAYNLRSAALIRTIREYNAAIDNGTAGDLDVPRSGGLVKLSAPPFYAIPVTAAVYQTFGGLLINENAQVLDIQKVPIPGLYSCPPCAGINREVYRGGIIGLAGTFGFIAGKTAAKS